MTPTAEEIVALLERVEKAEEFDREIDRDIGFALAGWRLGRVTGYPHECIIDQDGNVYSDHPDGEYPTFTESLDASIALVEKMLPGWGWQVGNPLPYDKPRMYYASVWRNGLHVGHDGWISEDGKPLPPRPSPAIYRATAPLALLAALLRALRSLSSPPPGDKTT